MASRGPVRFSGGVGWLGQNAPGTWAYDLSEALLWCRYAPPKPPTLTQTREQNGVAGAVCPRVTTPAFDVSGSPVVSLRSATATQSHSSPRTKRGGWGRIHQEHGPMTFQRLSCGVATLHQSHPIPLKPENKTEWLGQYAPGLQRRPLTCRRLSCGVATLHHSHPSSGAGKFQPEAHSGGIRSGIRSHVGFPSNQPALDQRQSLAFATRPRRTGFMWM